MGSKDDGVFVCLSIRQPYFIILLLNDPEGVEPERPSLLRESLVWPPRNCEEEEKMNISGYT